MRQREIRESRQDLITPEYRNLNIEMHYRLPTYGIGEKWAPFVMKLASEVGAKSVLDYGCGKGGLKYSLLEAHATFKIHEFDPAIPGKQTPHYADVVICADVLEHVEPQFTVAVVEELCLLANKALFVSVSCITGSKFLADGRSAHVNVQAPEWWESLFASYGKFERVKSAPHEYAAVLVKDWKKLKVRQ